MKQASESVLKLANIREVDLSTLTILLSMLYKPDEPADLGWDRLTENIQLDLHYNDRLYYLDIIYILKPVRSSSRQLLDIRDKKIFKSIIEAMEFMITFIEALPPSKEHSLVMRGASDDKTE